MGVAISDLLDGVRPVSGDVIAVLRGSETIKVPLPTLKRYLTETLHVYISPSGSDVSGDGSQGNPWATHQFAYDWIVRNINLNGYDALDFTDVVANRCFKAGVAFPAEWKAYVDALRSAYRAEEVIELPSPPKNEDGSIAYPAGT